jgi:hypothetical protein
VIWRLGAYSRPIRFTDNESIQDSPKARLAVPFTQRVCYFLKLETFEPPVTKYAFCLTTARAASYDLFVFDVSLSHFTPRQAQTCRGENKFPIENSKTFQFDRSAGLLV